MAIPDMIADPKTFTADGRFALEAAQAAIRRECGWHVTPSAQLEGAVNSRGGRIIQLPCMHITHVEHITDRDGRPLDYSLDTESGLLEITGTPPQGINAIRYQLTAGYDHAPDVLSVLVNIAKRAQTAQNGYITSQSVNGSSVSYNTATLFAQEQARLRPYKIIGRTT